MAYLPFIAKRFAVGTDGTQENIQYTKSLRISIGTDVQEPKVRFGLGWPLKHLEKVRPHFKLNHSESIDFYNNNYDLF